MFTLIRGVDVYTPEYIGIKDVLLSFDKIAWISDSIHGLSLEDVEVVDGSGKLLVPGLIDQHVHITGGGGEGGFANRTKEIELKSLVETGITTVVGVLGTDGYRWNYPQLGGIICQGSRAGAWRNYFLYIYRFLWSTTDYVYRKSRQGFGLD
jgi:isoaspartyl dipeptidase IadA